MCTPRCLARQSLCAQAGAPSDDTTPVFPGRSCRPQPGAGLRPRKGFWLSHATEPINRAQNHLLKYQQLLLQRDTEIEPCDFTPQRHLFQEPDHGAQDDSATLVLGAHGDAFSGPGLLAPQISEGLFRPAGHGSIRWVIKIELVEHCDEAVGVAQWL